MFGKHDFDSTILADKTFLTLDTWKSKLNNNVMLVGASGRGKTRHFLKPNIMQLNSNYVISDPKGALIHELGTLLEENGYTIKVLNLVDLKHSNTYNPFYYLKDASDVYKMLDYLIANLTPTNSLKSDPFWDESAKALLSAICFYLLYECNPEDRNFSNVIKLLSCEDASEAYENPKSTLDILFDDLAEKDPNHIAVKQYAIYKSVGHGKTAQSILITASVYMQYFNLVEYAALTSTNTIDMESLSTQKMALFVIISDTDRSKNWLAGLFYSQLFDLLCNQENKRHIRFILDDFVCTGRIPDFDYKMAMIRSRNLSCIVVIQDEAQLEKEYGQAAKGIISNCDSYVFLGSTNIESCTQAAKRLGIDNITAHHIRRLSYDKCVVVCGNEGGIYPKYELKKHPHYDKIAEDRYSPFYYSFENKLKIPQQQQMQFLNRQRRMALIEVKGGLFDSKEEKDLYMLLLQLPNISIGIHQHLRDIFVSEETAYSKKLAMMHCDFVLRDEKQAVVLAIEVDGNQHLYDSTQFANDRLKDSFFESCRIPLLRIPAADIRNQPNEVFALISQKLIDQLQSKNDLNDEDEETFIKSCFY